MDSFQNLNIEEKRELLQKLINEKKKREGYFPLSFQQLRLWILNEINPTSNAFNLCRALRWQGPLNNEMLYKSVQEIFDRHDSLRTTFDYINNEPVQKVGPVCDKKPIFTDLSALSDKEKMDKAQQIVDSEASRFFNIVEGPLAFTRLIRLDNEDHIFVFSIHHIISDGWSMGIFFKELSILYESNLNGRKSEINELPSQYVDYSIWQSNYLQFHLSDQLKFWKNKLKGITLTELNTDYPRPETQTFNGAFEVLMLDSETTKKLDQFCKQQKVTLFVTLLAVFKVLLYRLTDQEDISVGVPIANRNKTDVEGLIGFFINTLVMRTIIEGKQTFLDLLHKLRNDSLEAFSNQDLPFEKLLEELNPKKDLSRNSLFSVFFNVISYKTTALDVKFHKLNSEAFTSQDEPSAKFDITIYARLIGDEISIALNYKTDLFKKERMVELLMQYRILIEQILENPVLLLNEYHLNTVFSTKLLPNPLERLSYENRFTIQDLVIEQAKKTPENIALSSKSEQWTYRQIEEQSNRLAHLLISKGIVQNDIVSIYATRSPSLIISILGILKAGAAFLIIDPANPLSIQQKYIEISKTKALIKLIDFIDSSWEQEILKGKNIYNIDLKVFNTNSLSEYPRELPTILVNPENIAYLIFTSGTTGVPKGVISGHSPVYHFIKWHISHFGLNEYDKFSLLSGLSHDPILRDIFSPLSIGATLYIPEADTIYSGLTAEWLIQNNLSVCHLTPSLAEAVYNETSINNESKQIPALKLIFFGGEPLTQKTIKHTEQFAPNAELVNYYGATETPQGMCFFSYSSKETDSSAYGSGNILTIGKGIDNVQVLILNKSNHLCGIGELGEICIRTPYLSKGYINCHDEMQERFIVNPFVDNTGDRIYRTGDIGRYLWNGNIQILGRNDRQIKIRGNRIELEEIEYCLSKHEGVKNCTVQNKTDSNGDIQLVAYIILKENVDIERVKKHISYYLPNYMIPAYFLELKELPLTPNGKIDLNRLPRPEIKSAATLVAPRNKDEEKLTEVWSEILKIPQNRISITDNFFELGGNSLKAIFMGNKIHKEFDVQISVSELFNCQSIESISELISTKKWIISGKNNNAEMNQEIYI